MVKRQKAFLTWGDSEKESRESPKVPQVPDREVVTLYDAHGREIEMQRRVGFAVGRK